jgi:hypothetical protein
MNLTKLYEENKTARQIEIQKRLLKEIVEKDGTINDGNTIESLYHMLTSPDKFTEDSVFEYRELMIDLLALISIPEVQAKFDSAFNDEAGKMIRGLVHFFACIDHEVAHKFFGYFKISQYALNDEDLNFIERNYLEKPVNLKATDDDSSSERKGEFSVN